MKHIVQDIDKGIFFVRLMVLNEEGEKVDENVYVFSQVENCPFAPLLHIGKGELSVRRIDDGFYIKNLGKIVIPFLHGVEEEGRECIFIKDNYATLFPGEERYFNVESIGSSQSSLNLEDLLVVWKSFAVI